MDWTRVVVDSDGNMVGSVRIFEREWSVHDRAYKCAGLGEVCSDPTMRGKGVATVALNDAVKFCDETSGASFSALHAAAAVAPLYARFGYISCPISYSALDVPRVASLSVGVRCRPADVAREWEHLNALHDDINVRTHASGWTIRNKEYWTRWIKHIGGDSLLVLEALQSAGSWEIVAYAGVALKPDGCKLIDFGASAASDAPSLTRFIQHAAAVVLEGTTGIDWRVLIPSAIAKLLEDAVEAVLTHDAALADLGWMVRSLPGKDAVCDVIIEDARQGHFLVWQIDSF
jgi:hypothetical protein